MVRICLFGIIIAIIVFAVSGCSFTKPDPLPARVQTVEVKVPVFQCPANHRSIVRKERPPLALDVLTPEDKNDPGKVAVAYKASIKQLQQYAVSLEDGFDTYRMTCINAEGQSDEVK